MLAQTLEICELIKIYEKLLTNKQVTILKEYFYDNFSLDEIAELHKISKQGASDIITRAKKQLYKYENALNLLGKER